MLQANALGSRWVLAAFIGIVLFAYIPAWNGRPVWDDDKHMIQPELQSLDGLRRIWTDPHATQQYYPLVYSVFWVEHKLWGERPLPYHLLNIVLHGCSAWMLWLLLKRLEVPGAMLAAGLFALHPVAVESVAWISELKNTLSGALYFGAALVYLEFDSSRRRWQYALALALFILALLCKTVVASLPAALLVVFWWKRGRLRFMADALPLAPFFCAGVGSGLFTAWVERSLVGAQGAAFDFSIVDRCLIAGRAVWFYLGKLVWPVDLAFIYPRWHIDASQPWQYLFPLAVIGLLVGLAFVAPLNRGPLAAMLLFLGTLFPALGFVNVFPFRYSFVADHFQYLAGAGFFALLAAGAARWGSRGSTEFQAVSRALGLGLLGVLAVLTWKQGGTYSDVEALWSHSVAINPESFLAQNNLGNELLRQGRTDEALEHYTKAAELEPDGAPIHHNLGLALFAKGDVDGAIAEYRRALELKPDGPLIIYDLGKALAAKGHREEAIECYRRALRLQPDGAGIASTLGSALLASGDIDGAVRYYQKAVDLAPGTAKLRMGLAQTLIKQGRIAEALAQYEAGIRLQSTNVVVLANAAWVLATCPDPAVRDGARAVVYAERANRLTSGGSIDVIRILSAAYAEAGRFDDAIAAARWALNWRGLDTNSPFATELRMQLERCENHMPMRDESLAAKKTQ